MSPLGEPVTIHRLGFPRVSGDEPTDADRLCLDEVFSPRERG